jgi:DNA-binding NtrC family response regulator
LSERKRILIVDDDLSIRTAISIILESEGYIVDAVETGQEAIEKSKSNYYNLALLDYRLSDMEGTVLLSALKENTPKMVKIMVTGYPSMDNAIDSVNKKADAFLIKPVDPAILIQIVKIELKKQEEAEAYAEKKVTEFIETRIRARALKRL